MKRVCPWPARCSEHKEYGLKLVCAERWLALITQNGLSELGLFHPASEKALHISRGQTAKSSSSELGKVVQDIIFTKSTSILLTQPNLGRLESYV